ncbi:hypothetical protein [Nocardia heshunensis]
MSSSKAVIGPRISGPVPCIQSMSATRTRQLREIMSRLREITDPYV